MHQHKTFPSSNFVSPFSVSIFEKKPFELGGAFNMPAFANKKQCRIAMYPKRMKRKLKQAALLVKKTHFESTLKNEIPLPVLLLLQFYPLSRELLFLHDCLSTLQHLEHRSLLVHPYFHEDLQHQQHPWDLQFQVSLLHHVHLHRPVFAEDDKIVKKMPYHKTQVDNIVSSTEPKQRNRISINQVNHTIH